MLNIGKLAHGGAEYYLTTVATSVEAYYTGAGEAPGRWLGTASARLGLDRAGHRRDAAHGAGRRVSGRRAAAGRSRPHRPRVRPDLPGAEVGVAAVGARRPGRLPAGPPGPRRRGGRGAGLPRTARRLRPARQGRPRTGPADGFVAAAFRHRTSRADDPLLHTHVLVANLAHTTDDDRWRSLDARHLYLHAKTAGYLYQAQLRAELTRRLDVAFGPVTNGYADLEGIPRPLIEAFSRRRADILAALHRHGHTSARAAQVATLATRTAKSHADADRLRAGWRERAADLGFRDREVAAVTGRQADRDAVGERIGCGRPAGCSARPG
jgi:hypothetical protein